MILFTELLMIIVLLSRCTGVPIKVAVSVFTTFTACSTFNIACCRLKEQNYSKL